MFFKNLALHYYGNPEIRETVIVRVQESRRQIWLICVVGDHALLHKVQARTVKI